MPESTSIAPSSILAKAIKAVPAVKYALGIGGIVAVIAIIETGFRIDLRIAFFGTIVMFILMAILVVFASLVGEKKSNLHTLALVFAWFCLILFIATSSTLFSCVFFGKPLNLRRFVDAHAEAKDGQPTIPDRPDKNETAGSPNQDKQVQPPDSTNGSAPGAPIADAKNVDQATAFEQKGDSFIISAIVTKACLIRNCLNFNDTQRQLDEGRVHDNMNDATFYWQQALQITTDGKIVNRLSRKIAALGITCDTTRSDPCFENGSSTSHVIKSDTVDSAPDIRLAQ